MASTSREEPSTLTHAMRTVTTGREGFREYIARTFKLRLWDDEANMKDQKNEKKCKHSLSHLAVILQKINAFCQIYFISGSCLVNLLVLPQPWPEQSLLLQVSYIHFEFSLCSRQPLLSKGLLRVQPLRVVCNSRETL